MGKGRWSRSQGKGPRTKWERVKGQGPRAKGQEPRVIVHGPRGKGKIDGRVAEDKRDEGRGGRDTKDRGAGSGSHIYSSYHSGYHN